MTLQEALADKRRLIIDGAMGSELMKKGLPAGGPVNVDYQEQVTSVHAEYMQAGANILLTNTLTANALYYELHYPEANLSEENQAGAEAALKAAQGRCFVLGDVGPTGQMLPPLGTRSREEFVEAYARQAEVLERAGVDGFMVETMMDVQEACCAVEAIRQVSRRPILASMAYATTAKGCRTMMGHTAQHAVQHLTDAGVQAIGANCGELTPMDMVIVTSLLSELTTLPILVQPNAGRPAMQGSDAHYSMGPEDFAQGVSECVQQGAIFVGGCCGTTPEHIRVLAAFVNSQYR